MSQDEDTTMTDLEATNGCDAHKAMATCIHSIKRRQEKRDEEIVDVHKRIDSRVSTWLFCWIMGGVFAFLAFNVIMSISTSKEIAVAQAQLVGIETTISKIDRGAK